MQNRNTSDNNSSNTDVGSRIIGRYKITYHNDVIQEMDLITQDDYESIVKPTQDNIFDLKRDGKEKEADELKKQLKQMFGDNYFTDGSPIYQAFKTGILSLPKTQGGDKPCKVEAV